MADHITKKIMEHLSFLDKLTDLTKKINFESNQDQSNKVLSLINNRERLIQIIQQMERKIHIAISKENKNNDFIFQIYGTWKSDIKRSYKIICDLDKLSMNNFYNLKRSTKEKISKAFSLNQSHSAYLTNSLELY